MPNNIQGEFMKSINLIYGILLMLTICDIGSSEFKTERPPHEEFLNYGYKKFKTGRELENEIFKSKVEVLGDVLKKHVNILRKSPGQVVELVFLVDSSASVGAENFFSEVKFVKKLLADFTVSFNQTRVAVITFSSRNKVIRQVDHVTQSSLLNHKCSLLGRQLPEIRYSGGGTYTIGALMEAQSVLAVARADAVKAVFLVTDGYSNGGDPRPAAEFLKNRGVIFFTFGIQNGNVKELYDMASEPKEEHSYILNSFQEFEALARRALHEDLHNGLMIAQDSLACSILCEERDDCCDEYATCRCGTHTGHFACTCRVGYFGTGLKRSCKPCPSGTYKDVEGPSDITGCKACPDPNMQSPEGSISSDQCYCKRGYAQEGSQCQRVKCPALKPPPNGYFVRDTCERVINAACGIRCRPGYSLDGSSIRLCRADGTWSGGDATCIMKTCKMLKTPKNGDMICSSKKGTIDTQCHFMCKPGYRLVGSKMRTCLPVAMWDGIRAYCKPIFCPPLSPSKNGFLKPETCSLGKIPYGSRCEFGCSEGYQLSGPLKTVCTDKGMWSEGTQKARCIDVDPPTIRCPRNKKVITEPNEKYAFVEWEPPVVKDSSYGKVYVSTVPATKQPMRFKIGEHSVAFIAKDEWGNRAKCVFKISVKDVEPPQIDSCESPPTFLSKDEEVKVYWEQPIFSDNSGGALKVTRSREPGKFSQGKTVVEYRVSDPSGNTQACNITINVQKHACELPLNPIHGVANCSENPEAVYCTLTCEEGYAMALRPSQDYFCAYDGIWQPDSNPLPFPDCSVYSVSNTVSHSGEIAIEDASASVCDDIFFMGQIENKIQKRLEEALAEVCIDDLLCEIATVEAVCEGLLEEAEEEFNSIGFSRRKREVGHEHTIARFWPDDLYSNKWMYWARNSPFATKFNRRMKRDIDENEFSKGSKESPGFMLRINEFNSTNVTTNNKNKANLMGIITNFIVQTYGKNIGFSSISTFLTNLNTTKESFGVKEFIEAFSTEYGEEKSQELIHFSKKLFGTKVLQSPNPAKSANFTENWNISLSSMDANLNISDSLGVDQKYQRSGAILLVEDKKQSFSMNNLKKVEYQSDDPNESKLHEESLRSKENKKLSKIKKKLMVKFNVEGHGDKARKVFGGAIKKLLNWAEIIEVDIGEQQLKVAAIRLSEDPEYKCDPGSVPVEDLCVKCPIGTFFNVIAKECQSCPLGSYQPEEGQVSCKVCPENTSTKKGIAKSDVDCKAMCLPGSYSADGLEPCTTCLLGEYQDEYSSSSCMECPLVTTTWRRGSWIIDECKPACSPGKVSETGLEPCLPCPKQYFQAESGQRECWKCPKESHTANRSSTSFSDCIGMEETDQAALTSLESLEFNDCFSDPCTNDGSCAPLESGYTCNCLAGYSGQYCEIEINECQSDPCLNNGTCEDLIGAFQCTCLSGFDGDLCEVNIDECEPYPCKNNGTCVDLIDDFQCICESGYTGETCETNIDDCDEAPCSNSSTCIDFLNDYECVCPLGFEGRHCNIEIDECDSAPCIHGPCTDHVDDFTCLCELGYTGKQCNVDINDCESQPCENNGSCTDWLNGFSCSCPPGYTGKSCETLMSTDFVLNFPSSGINNYASLQGLSKALNSVTVCFWMKTNDKENYGTPFSYATDEHDNALTLTDYSGFVLYVNGEKKITDVYANDGIWHMISISWSSKEGEWKMYKDGAEVDSGDGLSVGKSIKADGVFVLGQEQDQKGGEYSAPESFIGEIILLNVWDEVLSKDLVKQLFSQCERYDGNIKSWPDFQSGIMGQIKIKSSTFCLGCGALFIPKYGTYTNTETFPGNLASLVCDNGYKLHSGDNERVCLVDGSWSGIEPECRPVSCGFPGLIRNGQIIGFNYDFRDVLIFSCKKEFEIVGNATRICNADGKWSGAQPECQIIKCPSPESIENGKLISHVSSYLPTNRVSFQCEADYQMDGPAFRECGNNGNWEGSQPFCLPKYCPILPKIQDGKVKNATDTSGSVMAIVSCNWGYKPDGGTTIVCKNDGTWKMPFPKCIRKRCDKPPLVQNGSYRIRLSLRGKQAKYMCDRGFVLDGPKLITCTKGAWDITSWPKCLPQPCPIPSIPEFGKELDIKRWSVGDEVVIECKVGYLLKGNSKKICQLGVDEGYWEGDGPVCEEIFCPVLKPIDGGSYRIIKDGKITKSTESAFPPVLGEIELLKRRRRSPDHDHGFPSIAQSSNDDFPPVYKTLDYPEFPQLQINDNDDYNELDHLSKSSDKQIYFPNEIQTFEPNNFSTNDMEHNKPDININKPSNKVADFESQSSDNLNYSDVILFSQNENDNFPEINSHTTEYITKNHSEHLEFDQDNYDQSSNSNLLNHFSNNIGDYYQNPDSDDMDQSHSNGFNDVQSEDYDYDGQRSNSDIFDQKFDGLDIFSQSSDYNTFEQSQDSVWDSVQNSEFDIISSQIPAYELGQSSTFDFDYEQVSDSFSINYSYDTIAEYECKSGYKLLGLGKRHCSDNGEWDQPEPRCYEQHCPGLQAIVDGLMTYHGNGVSSRVEFQCNGGFELLGESEIICSFDRTWSGKVPTCKPLQCETPIEPENGTVLFESTTFKSIASYSCSHGFVLEGSYERHCGSDGFWNGSLPRCVGIVCRTPSVIEKGYIYYEGNLNVGSTVEYGCNECYELIGYSISTCQLDESWSLEVPKCVQIKCNNITKMENGNVINGDDNCGSLIEYECNPGYEMVGSRKASCMEDSKWTSPPPICKEVSCGKPPLILNADILGTSFLYSDQIKYNCRNGYVIKGDATMTCAENKEWIGKVPECPIVNCTKPKGPSNGRVRVNGLFYGASVKIVCDSGFELVGDEKLMCQSNEKWDKEMPFCAPIICPPAPRPLNSYYNSTELYFETFTVLRYECDAGYYTNLTSANLLCSHMGSWEGEIIECLPINCGKPDGFRNGYIEGNMYTFGYIVDFFCHEEYELIGERKATCQNDGLWSSIPFCEKIYCEPPENIKFGKLIVNDTKFNTTLEYYCDKGYALFGISRSTCQRNGKWSEQPPKCIPISCPEPPEQINADITGNSYEFGQNLTYDCHTGFKIKGISIITCQYDGTWSSEYPICETIICKDPIDILNGQWKRVSITDLPLRSDALTKIDLGFKGSKMHSRKQSKTSKLSSLLEYQYEKIIYRFGHIIEYSCNEGYFKTTNGITECTENGWNANSPKCYPISCPQPIQIQNGNVIWGDAHFGAIIRYDCNEGYNLLGVLTRQCQANKQWKDAEPYCRPKECPRPAELLNGRTIIYSIKYKSIVSYVCNPGFRLEGPFTRICQSDEKWSDNRPFCAEIFCDEPEIISHANIDISDLKVGGKVRYSCVEGYTIDGNSILNCQSDGNWDKEPPKCDQIDCGSLNIDHNGNISSRETTYASKVRYTCVRGYKLYGSEWTTCLHSGRWSHEAPACEMVTCKLPKKPNHGIIVGKEKEEEDAEMFERENVSFIEKIRKYIGRNKSKNRGKKSKNVKKFIAESTYVVDDEISFKCYPGYQIVGSSLASCGEDGTWSIGTPKCQRISCGSPNIPKHSTYFAHNFLFEDQIILSCEKGYILRGNPNIKCLEDGRWKGSDPICEPVSCGSPAIVSNSHVTMKIAEHGLPHHYGSIITYSCDEGYILEGSVFMTCESTGRWIGPRETPVCVEMPCGDPPNLTYGNAQEVRSVPQAAIYNCEQGYVLSGVNTIYCSLGRWNGLNASCYPVNCYDPPVPKYGLVTTNHFTFGGIANYSCLFGYEVRGSPYTICGASGLWSGEIPECQKVDCGAPEGIPFGKVFFNSTLFEDEVNYRCDDGYELKGSRVRQCTAQRSWSGHLPQCHRFSCGELQPPDKGFIIGVGQHFGDKVRFSCDKGHVLVGSEESVCQADGTWTGNNPKCEGVICDFPNPIRNGMLPTKNIRNEQYIFGDKLYYLCQEGHIPRGDLAAECQKNGKWSPVKGQCSRISCGRPKINQNGAIILGRSFYYNDKVRIKCLPGMKIDGSSQLTCLNNGQWSGNGSCIGRCSLKCFNGGVCLNENVCSCLPGFIGKRCEKAVCLLSCLNGGTCEGPYKCRCAPGFGGKRCQRPICDAGCGRYGKCIGPNICLCQYGQTASSCPDYSDYADFGQQEITQYNDWDI